MLYIGGKKAHGEFRRRTSGLQRNIVLILFSLWNDYYDVGLNTTSFNYVARTTLLVHFEMALI